METTTRIYVTPLNPWDDAEEWGSTAESSNDLAGPATASVVTAPNAWDDAEEW